MSLARPRRADLAAAGLVVGFAGWFGTLQYLEHRQRRTGGFDLGIYDQAIWLLATGNDPFLSTRGLDLWGHHMNPILLAWVPAYWLGAGAGFLAVSQVVLVALAAVPVYLLARDRLGDGMLAVGLAAAFLLNPSVEHQAVYPFHPDTVAMLPVLTTWLLATRRRWGWAAVAAVVALASKEEIALTLVAMGIVLAWRERRRVFLLPAAVAGLWFVLASRVIVPWRNDGLSAFYDEHYGHLGSTTGEIAWNTVRHPSRWVGRVLDARSTEGSYWLQLFAPYAFAAPLLALPELVLFLPQALLNAVSRYDGTTDIRFQYSAMPVAALTICVVEGIGRLRQEHRRRAVTAVVAAAVAANAWWSPSPIGRQSDVLTPREHPAEAAIADALASIPGDASVSASSHLVPHLTHRREVYVFPVPFDLTLWGVEGSPPPDADDLEYVVVDTTVFLDDDEQAAYEALIQTGSGFEIRSAVDGIVVLTRDRCTGASCPTAAAGEEPPPGSP